MQKHFCLILYIWPSGNVQMSFHSIILRNKKKCSRFHFIALVKPFHSHSGKFLIYDSYLIHVCKGTVSYATKYQCSHPSEKYCFYQSVSMANRNLFGNMFLTSFDRASQNKQSCHLVRMGSNKTINEKKVSFKLKTKLFTGRLKVAMIAQKTFFERSYTEFSSGS